MKLVVALALPAAALRPVKVTMSAAQNRRAFVIGGTAAAAAAATKANAYSLPDLPYAYDALEPSIDAATMKFHHDKHHATYVAGINGKLDEKDQPPIADLMKIAKDKGYNNAGGGVYNHDMFWQAMAPKGKGGAPSAALSAAIDKSFGSMDKMKEEWEALAAPASTFGSGWVWLYVKGAARRGISRDAVELPKPRRQGPEAGQHAEPGQPAHEGRERRGHPHFGHRRVGARVLPQVPEPPPGVRQGLLGRRQLEPGLGVVRRRARRQGAPVLSCPL